MSSSALHNLHELTSDIMTWKVKGQMHIQGSSTVLQETCTVPKGPEVYHSSVNLREGEEHRDL